MRRLPLRNGFLVTSPANGLLRSCALPADVPSGLGTIGDFLLGIERGSQRHQLVRAFRATIDVHPQSRPTVSIDGLHVGNMRLRGVEFDPRSRCLRRRDL